MVSLSPSYLASFWSHSMIEVNLLIFLYLAGALALGLLLGYERSYHGRAAGMRTYGIVCMASAALTVFCGYPGYWWGGSMPSALPIDPSRVIQGIVTGVGFLGAVVIMKEGLNISGLTTAASIWASSAIGVQPKALIACRSVSHATDHQTVSQSSRDIAGIGATGSFGQLIALNQRGALAWVQVNFRGITPHHA